MVGSGTLQWAALIAVRSGCLSAGLHLPVLILGQGLQAPPNRVSHVAVFNGPVAKSCPWYVNYAGVTLKVAVDVIAGLLLTLDIKHCRARPNATCP